MTAPDDEAVQKIEELVTKEERDALTDPGVPEDVKAEILERLERFRESDLEQTQAEDAHNPPY